jgi:nitroreductase
MNETLRTIHSLRSVHGGFTTQRIDAADLQAILEAAVRAASASARQSYSIIVVDDRADMKEYLQYVGDKALIFCVDYNRLADTAAYLQQPFGCGGLTDFITGSTDTILAAQTAAIAAKSLGIDSLFTNSIHRGDLRQFYAKFNLPGQRCFPLIALVLGYAAHSGQPGRGRLTGPGIIHHGQYRRLAAAETGQIVAAYDRPDQNMGLIFRPDPSQSRYFDWFYKVWCKPKDPAQAERKQLELYQVLQTTGFLDNKYGSPAEPG